MMRTALVRFALVCFFGIVGACAGVQGQNATPTPTPTPSHTSSTKHHHSGTVKTPTPTPTPVPSAPGANTGDVSGNSSGDSGDSDSDFDGVHFVDKKLAGLIKVERVNTELSPMKLLTVYVAFKNKTHKAIDIQVQTNYADVDKKPLSGEDSWIDLTLKPREESEYCSVALSADARSYLVQVRLEPPDGSGQGPGTQTGSLPPIPTPTPVPTAPPTAAPTPPPTLPPTVAPTPPPTMTPTEVPLATPTPAPVERPAPEPKRHHLTLHDTLP